jgi:hypothetical protein
MPRRPDGHSRAHAAPPRKARAPAASSSTDKRRWRRSGRCLTTHFPFVVPNIWFYYIRFVGQSPNRWGTHGNSRFVRAARAGAHFRSRISGRAEVRRGGAPKDGSPGGSIKAAPLSAGEMRRDPNPDRVPTWVHFFRIPGRRRCAARRCAPDPASEARSPVGSSATPLISSPLPLSLPLCRSERIHRVQDTHGL